MKKSMSLFLVIIMMMGSFEAFGRRKDNKGENGRKAGALKTDDDNDCPDSVDLVPCENNSECSGGEGCFESDANELEGAGWWTSMWRRENGKTCNKHTQCDSGFCDDHQEEDGEDDKKNKKYKTVSRCSPLKVCKKGEFGDYVSGSIQCEDGLIPDLSGKCINGDMTDLEAMLNGGSDTNEDLKKLLAGETDPSKYTNIINRQNCSVIIPSTLTTTYRFNYALLQMFNYVFAENDGDDCLGIGRGLKQITARLMTAQTTYNTSVVDGLRAQNANFTQNLHMPTDRSKKNEIDAYNLGLTAFIANQEVYILANDKLKGEYDAALGDLTAIQEYYSQFTWKKDAESAKSDTNKHRYTLKNGFSFGVRDRDSGNGHYCRGKSLKMKNSFDQRYRAFDGTHNGIAEYLNLTYSNLHKNREKHANEKAYFLLDPPLPKLDHKSGINAFKFFGTKASTRAKDSKQNDGEPRARISKDLIEFMMDYYLVQMYDRFKNDGAFLAKSSANSSGSSLGEITINPSNENDLTTDMGKINRFINQLKTNRNSIMGGTGANNADKDSNDYLDPDHKDEANLFCKKGSEKKDMEEKENADAKNNRDDLFSKYFFVNSTQRIVDVTLELKNGKVIASPALDSLVKSKFTKIRLKNKDTSTNVIKDHLYMSSDSASRVYDPHLINLLLHTINDMGKNADGTGTWSSPGALKKVIAFQKLMYDARQRFYHIVYLFSAGRTKKYPNTEREIFWDLMSSALNSNVTYLNAMTTVHSLTKKCLGDLRSTWEEQTKQESLMDYSSKDYEKNNGIKVDTVTVGQTPKNCAPGQPCQSQVGINAGSIKSMKDNKMFGSGGLSNLSGKSGVGAMGAGQMALANAKKRKAKEFKDNASPAMSRARDEANEMLKAMLTPPSELLNGSSSGASDKGGSSFAMGGGSAGKKEEVKKEVPGTTPQASTLGDEDDDGPQDAQLNFGGKKRSSDEENSDIPPELAETLLSESKNENYKVAEGDELFTIITKTYIRAGLPRLLQRKTEIKTNEVKHEDEEVFNPGSTKKKLDKLE